jgi:hypothetical protein
VTVSLNQILWLLSALGEAVVIGLLAFRHGWKTLPWFFIFCIWALAGDVAEYAVMHFFPAHYFTVYFATRVLDSVLLFCVLVEVAWSIFRPFRASLPPQTLYVLGGLIAVIGIAVWPFADSAAYAHYPMQWHQLARLQQTGSILRIVFFLILAACSQLLSIGWRDRELQVVTGLGFYSFVALTTTVLRAHQSADQYRVLDQFLVASYIVCLLYWTVSFAQKEAERREFTPQMQGLLLAVAGAARTTRISLSDHSDKPGREGRP